MGMFDYLYYEGKEYQTKNTPNQFLDKYKIEPDQESGHSYLWVEEYDAEWTEDKEALLGGYLRHFNERWVRCDKFDGLICFYRSLDKKHSEWEDFEALFMNGRLIKFTKKEKTK